MKSNGTDTLAEHVQLVRLADMAGWERNPHKHPESQLSTLASLVRRFGFSVLREDARKRARHVGAEGREVLGNVLKLLEHVGRFRLAVLGVRLDETLGRERVQRLVRVLRHSC